MCPSRNFCPHGAAPRAHLSGTTAVPKPWELSGAGNRNNCPGAVKVPIFASLSLQPGLSPPEPRSPSATGPGGSDGAGSSGAPGMSELPSLSGLCSRTWLGSQQPPAHPKALPLQGKWKDAVSSSPCSFQKAMWDGLGPSVAGLGGNPRRRKPVTSQKRIMESLRLERTFKIVNSNHQFNPTRFIIKS